MRGGQRDGSLDIAQRAVQLLLGQRVHQVEVDIAIARILRRLHRRLGLAGRMNATQSLELGVVETLDAER